MVQLLSDGREKPLTQLCMHAYKLGGERHRAEVLPIHLSANIVRSCTAREIETSGRGSLAPPIYTNGVTRSGVQSGRRRALVPAACAGEHLHVCSLQTASDTSHCGLHPCSSRGAFMFTSGALIRRCTCVSSICVEHESVGVRHGLCTCSSSGSHVLACVGDEAHVWVTKRMCG